jgi:hypothetical protein
MKKAWSDYTHTPEFPFQVILLFGFIIFGIGAKFGIDFIMILGGGILLIGAFIISCMDDY